MNESDLLGEIIRDFNGQAKHLRAKITHSKSIKARVSAEDALHMLQRGLRGLMAHHREDEC